MKSGALIRNVEFDSIMHIPVDGLSFPLNVYTANPPYDNLEVNIEVVGLDPLVAIN
jgi:hypothetical protein